VIGTLTVRENLWFSANLRLPRSISRDIKRKRIEEILYDLGLTGCADTKVGIHFTEARVSENAASTYRVQLTKINPHLVVCIRLLANVLMLMISVTAHTVLYLSTFMISLGQYEVDLVLHLNC